MSDKYYTPEIEELYIGLECEYSKLANTEGHNHPNWDIRDDVIEAEIDTLLLKYIIHDIVENGCEMPIRVKYLDKNDIESLGFKSTGGAMVEGGKYYFKKEVYGIILRPNFYEDGFPDVHIYKYMTLRAKIDTRFSGKIKNKNELAKLIKQLNIETDEK